MRERTNRRTNERMLSLNHANPCIIEERVERTTQSRKLHPALCAMIKFASIARKKSHQFLFAFRHKEIHRAVKMVCACDYGVCIFVYT